MCFYRNLDLSKGFHRWWSLTFRTFTPLHDQFKPYLHSTLTPVTLRIFNPRFWWWSPRWSRWTILRLLLSNRLWIRFNLDLLRWCNRRQWFDRGRRHRWTRRCRMMTLTLHVGGRLSRMRTQLFQRAARHGRWTQRGMVAHAGRLDHKVVGIGLGEFRVVAHGE